MAMTCREVLLQNPEGSRVRLIPQLSLDMDKADIPEQVPFLTFISWISRSGWYPGDRDLWCRPSWGARTWKSGSCVAEFSYTRAFEVYELQHDSLYNAFIICRVVPAKAEFKTAPVECVSVSRGLTLESETIGYLDVSSTRWKLEHPRCTCCVYADSVSCLVFLVQIF